MKFLHLFCSVALVVPLCLAGCQSQVGEEKERPFTPLYVYFDPLNLKLTMTMEALMPFFVNYPNDWTKMGLRGNPSTLTYSFTDPFGTGNYVTKFSESGRMKSKDTPQFSFYSRSVYYWHRVYEYDEADRLNYMSEYRPPTRVPWEDKGFVYNEKGQLTERFVEDHDNSGIRYNYSYWDNGNLKAIRPVKDNAVARVNMHEIYKLDFDSQGLLERMVCRSSVNPFLSRMNRYKKGAAVMSYTHSDRLCTKIVEKVPIEFDRGVDTLTNTFTLAYNAHGDVTSWVYSGGVYWDKGNRWGVADRTFEVKYEYTYDLHDNWTSAKMILPEGFEEIMELAILYHNSLMYTDHPYEIGEVLAAGEVAEITLPRTVEYEFDAADVAPGGTADVEE